MAPGICGKETQRHFFLRERKGKLQKAEMAPPHRHTESNLVSLEAQMEFLVHLSVVNKVQPGSGPSVK